MTSGTDTPPPKLNILVLPTQTFIIFLLIVGTVLGAALLGSLGGTPIPFWGLALALLLLPIRAFLRQSEQEAAKYDLQPAEDGLSLLAKEIEEQASRLDLPRTPHLLIGAANTPIYTYGTFRHWYLAMSPTKAYQLQEKLGDPHTKPVAHATILHELAHFKTGDYWQLGYVYQLLRYTFWVMLWGLLFFGGLGLLLFLSVSTFATLDPTQLASDLETLTPEQRELFLEILPSPQEFSELRQQIDTVNLGLVLSYVFNATLPFIILAAILQYLYWPKLWRVRELYADAGVWITQQGSNPLIAGLMHIPLHILDQFPFVMSGLKKTKGMCDGCSWHTWWATIKQLRSKHPNDYRRLSCMQDSQQVFDSWPKTAFLVGSLTLLLDILLSTPVGLLYVGNWPMHFSTIVILVILSIATIPQVAINQLVWKDLFTAIAIIMMLRLGWLLFTIGLLLFLLIVAPQTLSEILSSGVSSIARFAGYSDNLIFDDLSGFVLQASIINLAQIFIIWLILTAGLSLNALLLRRVFTWYSLQKRIIQATYTVVTTITLLVAFSILPLLTQLLLTPVQGLNIMGCVFFTTGITLTGIGGGLFIHFDRKYSHRCPNCDWKTQNHHHFGEQCKNRSCLQYLDQWLIADMNDE